MLWIRRWQLSFLQRQTQLHLVSRPRWPSRQTSLPPETCWLTSCRSLKLEVQTRGRIQSAGCACRCCLNKQPLLLGFTSACSGQRFNLKRSLALIQTINDCGCSKMFSVKSVILSQLLAHLKHFICNWKAISNYYLSFLPSGCVITVCWKQSMTTIRHKGTLQPTCM